MSKANRELRQRLEELFSSGSQPEPVESPPARADADQSIDSVPALADQSELGRLKTILDHIPLPVYIKDRDHKWVAVNPAFCELLGQPAGVLIGHADKEQSDDAWKQDDLVLETGQPDDVQESITQPDGSICTRRVRRIPLSSEQNPVEQVLGIIEPSIKPPATGAAPAVDREALLAEIAEHQQNTERFKAIVEAMPIPIVITRAADDRALYANARAAGLFGVPLDELLYRSTPDFYYVPSERQRILALLKHDGRIMDYELRVKKPDGAPIWVMLSVQPMAFNGEAALLSSFYDITDHKLSGHTAEEPRFQAAFEHTVIGMALVSTDGQFLHINYAWSTLLGYTEAEMLKMRFRDITHPDDIESSNAYLRKMLAGELGELRAEKRYLHKDGHIVWVQLFAVLVRDSEGQPLYFISQIQDITERRQAETVLRESEERYRDLFDNAVELIQSVTPDGKFIYVNRAWRETLGYDESEIARLSMLDVVHPDSQAHCMATFQRVLNGEKAEHVEATFVAKNGQAIIVEGSASASFKDGQPVATRGMFHDVTARKRVEEDLRKFKFGIERTNAAIFITDKDGRIVYVNPAFEQIYGYSRQEAMGKTPRILKSGVIPQERYREFWNTLLSKQVVAGEIVNKAKDGRLVPIEGSNNPILDENGDIIGFLGIHHDMTVRKQAEVERERLLSTESTRAAQLRVAAEVTNAATSILSLDDLLPVVVELIRERFDLYYVGLFLADETNQWAVLRAGTGEAGRKMLAAKHRLGIDGASMIGWCIARAQPRIALDVGEDAVRFNNPLLPHTRTEAALPLVSRGHAIGALTIQSTQLGAFTPEDVTALQTMVGQVATAIENARLFEQTQTSLTEMDNLYRAGAELNIARSYDDVLAALCNHTRLGAGASGISILYFNQPWTIDNRPTEAEVLAQMSDGKLAAPQPDARRFHLMDGLERVLQPNMPTLIANTATDPRLSDQLRDFYRNNLGVEGLVFLPLVVGGQWIGYVNALYPQSNHLPETEMRRLTLLTAQAAVAVQNIHSIEQTRSALAQTQRLARHQQTVAEISDRMYKATDVKSLLDIATEELRRATGSARAIVRLRHTGSQTDGSAGQPAPHDKGVM